MKAKSRKVLALIMTVVLVATTITFTAGNTLKAEEEASVEPAKTEQAAASVQSSEPKSEAPSKQEPVKEEKSLEVNTESSESETVNEEKNSEGKPAAKDGKVALTDSAETVPTIALSSSKVELTSKGETFKLIANVTDEPAESIIIWKSSDENVATVSNGTVRATGEGKAEITATLLYENENGKDREVSVKAHVTVTYKDQLLYYYALIPGASDSQLQNPDQNWFGLGVAKISGAPDPKTLKRGFYNKNYIDYTVKEETVPLCPNIT